MILPFVLFSSQKFKIKVVIIIFIGRKKIKTDMLSSEINEKNIETVINKVLPLFKENSNEIQLLRKYYIGVQPILNKLRPNESEDTKNNIVLENHALKLITFKKDYLVGNGFKYSQSDDKRTDDVTMLNKYFADENKNYKDIMLAEDMYCYGTAYRFVSPKLSGTYDIKGEAPFNLLNLEAQNTFVAYSTNVEESVAFSCVATCVDIEHREYVYTVYTNKKIFTLKGNDLSNAKLMPNKTMDNTLGINPIVEYALNKNRIGVIDVAYSVLNALNIITSNQVDDIVDFVNSLLVLYNVNIDEKSASAISEMRELGLIVLDDKNPQIKAKAEYIASTLNHAEINQFYDRLVKSIYDIVGVPIASGQVTSGGDTGVARALGNGYESADLIIKGEESAFISSEKDILRIILKICKMTNGCKVNELYPCDVEINPTRHNLDNILSKAQSLKYFVDMGMPYETALILVGVSSNPHEVALMWEENANKKLEKTVKNTVNNIQNSNMQSDKGINSSMQSNKGINTQTEI